jgi:Mg-chelatase subunit ChlD
MWRRSRGMVLLGAVWVLGCQNGLGDDRELANQAAELLSPAAATFTVRAGDPTLGTVTEGKTVEVPAKPPKADIEIAIDTTGSMSPSIAQAKLDATAIVLMVQAQIPNTRFAVVEFRDAGDANEYRLVLPMTAAAAEVQGAINGLSAGGGGDAPEAYNLVFRNSYSDPAVGWRPDSRKFVVVIGDAQPHGNLATQGLAGCGNVTPDPHGLTTSAELAQMNLNVRTLMMILQTGPSTTTSLGCYQSLAAGAFPGGQAVPAAGSLATQIVDLINAAFANVSDLHLEVVAPNPNAAWISFAPAARGPIPAPSTQTFTLSATVPAGTPPGSYSFDIVALADGADVGHQSLTLQVVPKLLTLAPATATRPIGTAHTVVAHVFDVLGPYAGDSVGFSVAGIPAVPMAGSATTNAGGLASFSFTNTPPNPGSDTITASDGPLLATAKVLFVNTPPSCGTVKLGTTALWPPNHKLVSITASGATDGDIGDSATLVIDAVTQDEAINGLGDGDTAPDAVLSTPLSNKVSLRAERSGGGDGRVYRVHYTATDTHGATCSGEATVGVPHDHHSAPVDSAPPSFDSLIP